MNRKKNTIRLICRFTLIGLSCLIGHPALAQEDSSGNGKKEISIELSLHKKADLSKTIEALSTTMGKDNKWVPATLLAIDFYAQEGSGLTKLQRVLSNAKGVASLQLPGSLAKDAQGVYRVIAKVENNKEFQDAEEKIEFKDANLSLIYNPSDSGHLVTARVSETAGNGVEIPVPGAEVSFFVQRLFGVMPAGEDFVVTTDSTGEAAFSYPSDIMGDRSGKITLVAKIVDHKLYGTVEAKGDAKWGKMLPVEVNPFPRALIMPRAPMQLIITLVILFGGIWATYFFIFYQLRKISKEKRLVKDFE